MGEYSSTEANAGWLYRALDSPDTLLSRRLASRPTLAQDQYTSAPPPFTVTPHAQQPLLVYHPLLRSVHINNLLQKNFLAHPPPATTVSQVQNPGPLASRPAQDTTKKAQPKPHPAPRHIDGNNGVSTRATSGKSQVTDSASMSSRGSDGVKHALPARPPMTSHHSNSVPSTPHQHARDIAFRSRTPSPNGALGNHSPRSVSSEANGPMPSLRKQPYKCKYETHIAFGRRRMGYDNADMLEKAAVPPKASLNPDEEEKLSGDMRELYDRLLPSEESQKRRKLLVEKLGRILRTEWPGNEFKVHVFGSSGNLLCTAESDVDVCIQTPMKKLESVHMLAEALAKHGMSKVVCVASAKVPIVKVWDPELELACDMNVNNTLALENTRMIKTYVQIDERVRPLTMIIKYWTKQRILNDAAMGGTLSSYTWICMVLNFLQTRNPPVLPSLHQMPFEKHPTETGEESSFFDDLDKVRGFGEANKESLGQLLFQFFRLYGHDFDYERDVVSVRNGRFLTRKEKGWEVDSGNKEGRFRLCVEEPFNISRNLGNSADDYAFRGIHLEIRQAFDLLADGGQLEKACEQYVYPKEERPTFQKPPPAPKPTLTHSTSPSRRGGRGNGNRGGRNLYNQRNSQGDRSRSSSGAYTNGLPFLSPPLAGAGPDYFAVTTGASLHEQLYKQYQMLEMQQHSLKAQLFAQAQARAAQAQAQAIAHAQAQARNGSNHGSPPKTQYVTTQPVSRDPNEPPATAPIMPQYLYPYPNGFEQPQPMSQSHSQDGVRTNPSSPSLPLSIPQRRGVHRATVAEGQTNSAIRSHSQPARADQNALLLTGYPPIPSYPPNLMAYPIARSSQETAAAQQQPVDVPQQHAQCIPAAREPAQNGSPKEYYGYFMNESPQHHFRPNLQDYTVQQIPSFQELAQRRKRISPDLAPPQHTQAQQHASRSPSPLGQGHNRSFSTGIRQTPTSAPPLQASEKKTPPVPPIASGPVIVNGSYRALQSREQRSLTDSIDSNGFTDRDSVSSLAGSARPDEPFPMEMPEQQQQQQIFTNELLRRHFASSEPEGLNGVDVYGTVSQAPAPSYALSATTVQSHYHLSGDEYSTTTGMQSNNQNVPPWRVKAAPNGVSHLDTSRTSTAPPQTVKSAALPILSPVQETRTPSPTASRGPVSAGLQPTNGTSIGGGVSDTDAQPAPPRTAGNHNVKQQSPHPTKDSLNAHEKPSSKGGAGGNSTSNGGWQKSGGGKKGGRKRAKSNASRNGEHRGGEPLPANEADRKGG
ncbi:PAP/25A-associated [Macrophomina phaseolina MS6]|uniref:polynucleotide adenylyltransferase n=1 Tax=Macrophomina phaseolina (strain MS6) TaxID=1126212 RepID=K2QQ12_MACPH|nr:PAP/25A-associated [Macrophomina phaseolina MS6]